MINMRYRVGIRASYLRKYLKYFLQYLQGAHSKKSDKTIIKIICETYDAVSFAA